MPRGQVSYTEADDAFAINGLGIADPAGSGDSDLLVLGPFNWFQDGALNEDAESESFGLYEVPADVFDDDIVTHATVIQAGVSYPEAVNVWNCRDGFIGNDDDTPSDVDIYLTIYRPS